MSGPSAGLWDWRRRIADLYADVRSAAAEPEASWHYWRRVRDRLFRLHPLSPLERPAREAFLGLRYFDYDPAWRHLAELEWLSGEAPVAVDAGAEGRLALVPFARTRGLAGALGAELTLYWIGGYGGGVFLPFRDETSGRATYGGGRYLLDTIKGTDLGLDAEARAIIDLNFAYNPSCAYSARWTCPLPPEANRLAVPVAAGEKAPA